MCRTPEELICFVSPSAARQLLGQEGCRQLVLVHGMQGLLELLHKDSQTTNLLAAQRPRGFADSKTGTLEIDAGLYGQ